ncbi:DEAD-box ATP-dependent RNA helicase 29, partial [Haematococcus lacustris]
MALEEEEDQLESDDAPGQNHGVVAFSEDEEEGESEGKPAKLSGRRARREKELKKKMRTGTFVLVGGDALEAQFAELANNPDVLVATPGRLLHHLAEVEGLGLRSVEYCVVDEADRMFEMGFAEQ